MTRPSSTTHLPEPDTTETAKLTVAQGGSRARLPDRIGGYRRPMTITEAPTPPKGVQLPLAHKIVARLALVDNREARRGTS